MNIERAVINIRRGVKNLIYWVPKIWGNHNWDHYYLYKIIYHKLMAMEPSIRRGMTSTAEHKADQIKYAAHLLKLVMDDVHEEYYSAVHDEKWGELHMTLVDAGSMPGYHKAVFTRENAVTPEEKEQERKEFLEVMNRAFEEREKTKKLFFKFLADNIDGWWD